MAGVEDYKKLRSTFKSQHESALQTFKTIISSYNTTQAIAEALAKIGAATDKIQKVKQQSNKIYLEWTTKAKEVEELQAELKVAEKAKDAAKIRDLKGLLDKKHTAAEKVRETYQANIDTAIATRDEEGKRARALVAKLPF